MLGSQHHDPCSTDNIKHLYYTFEVYMSQALSKQVHVPITYGNMHIYPLVYWVIFTCSFGRQLILISSKNQPFENFRNTIRMSNSLSPSQA